MQLKRTTTATHGLGEVRGVVFSRMGYQRARTMIQKGARRSYIASGRPVCCFFCGYDRHVDIAHRKGVMSFPENTLVDVINHPDNLIALCPNHHREADSGMIDLIAAKSLEAHFGHHGFVRPPHSEKKRRHRQRGTVTLKERRKGPSVWVFRYQENGKKVSITLGDQEKYPTKELAQLVAQSLRKTKMKEFPHAF